VRVGILKPDHFGDLILAAPAIAVLRRQFDDLVLLCHPRSASLAEHLYPGLPLRRVVLPHLDKTRRLSMKARPLSAICRDLDLLVCLRWDAYMHEQVESAEVPYRASGLDLLDIHVAAEHRCVVGELAAQYDPVTAFEHPDHESPRERPARARSIGLCISAGCELNRWPLNHWLELAQQLHRRGMRVVLVGGPDERVRLHVLAPAVAHAIGYGPRVLIGGDDFAGFVSALADAVDLVVATDSGTAHLAALGCPVLSLFGGSPWRRYAPLGRANAVLFRGVHCSPCRQFDRLTMNPCVARECLTGLTPDDVMAGLEAYLGGVECRKPRRVGSAWMVEAPWEMKTIDQPELRARVGSCSLPLGAGCSPSCPI
jgi:ADP-heptose:LPS heptosyltransferase